MIRGAARTPLATLAALVAAGCAATAPAPGSFAFAVMGDTPYGEAEERRFEAMMAAIDAEPLAFVVHVGDFKGGGACSDALFERRRAQFDRSAHPFVFTPGDNEWADCRRPGRAIEPLERLAKLRALFFAKPQSLGRSPLPMQAQSGCLDPPVEGCGCGALPENRRWSHGSVAFVTLHVVGSRDNTGVDSRHDAEARCRLEANRRWLARAFEDAAARGALVVFMQANPIDTWAPTYGPLLEQLARSAAHLRKPVLLAHGDTHSWRVDFPFPWVTRLETFGSPFVGWVKVTVEADSPAPFRFAPRW